MKKDKKHAKEQNDSNRLLLDDILNANDPEIKQFMVNAMKEEMSKISNNAPEEGAEAMERATIRVAWHFKDKLTPQMQQILVEQHPAPDAA